MLASQQVHIHAHEGGNKKRTDSLKDQSRQTIIRLKKGNN
jgi:hypothetical protein